MNIKAMLLRENFYSICEKTLMRYFHIATKQDVVIRATRSRLRNQIVVYPRMGVIATRFPDSRVIQYLLNEYNIRGSRVKNLVAKIGVLGFFCSFGLLAPASLSFSEPGVFKNTDAVIPANRKLRIYRFEQGYVDAIIKDTFTRKYFERELSFRINTKWDFIPKILEYGEDWYREPLLPGQALARVREEDVYEKNVDEAIRLMGLLVQQHSEERLAADYCTELYQSISQKMEIARKEKKIDCFERIMKIAEAAKKRGEAGGGFVPLAESHGDLQSGNVWVDKKNAGVYILDWETHGFRSVWYDCATLLLSIRRAGKRKEMMTKLNTPDVKDALLRNDPCKDRDMGMVLAVITLEDILFYLDDMLELPYDYGSDIFNQNARQFEQMGWETLDE